MSVSSTRRLRSPIEGADVRGIARDGGAEHSLHVPRRSGSVRPLLQGEKGLRGSTLHEYERIGERLAERPWRSDSTWADRVLDTFSEDDLLAVRRELTAAGRSADTLNHNRRVVRGIFGTHPTSPALAWAWMPPKVCSSDLYRRFVRACKRAGLPRLSFHELRHTFGTQAIRKFKIHEVQRMMGHRHITTTERYLHHACPTQTPRRSSRSCGATAAPGMAALRRAHRRMWSRCAALPEASRGALGEGAGSMARPFCCRAGPSFWESSLFWASRTAAPKGQRCRFAGCFHRGRRRPESNRCRRLCRPLRSHSATSPGGIQE